MNFLLFVVCQVTRFFTEGYVRTPWHLKGVYERAALFLCDCKPDKQKLKNTTKLIKKTFDNV